MKRIITLLAITGLSFLSASTTIHKNQTSTKLMKLLIKHDVVVLREMREARVNREHRMARESRVARENRVSRMGRNSRGLRHERTVRSVYQIPKSKKLYLSAKAHIK